MSAYTEIIAKIEAGGRIDREEALQLWYESPLWELARVAMLRRRQINGDRLYYNRNIHIEPTNRCIFNCRFCSYRRPVDSPEMWDYSMEEVEALARRQQGRGLTEVHIVGGVHPDHDLDYYCEMIRRVQAILPEVSIKAFTAIELSYMIRQAGLTPKAGLERLIEAGMAAIPGGGAEIFDEKIRAQICPEKGSTAEWFEIHRTAHELGLRTNCTILYGHVELIEHRIDHLLRLRDLQDETHGFDAFIPLKYRNANNALSEVGEVSVVEDLRMLALSRILLDNIDHLKAYWVMYGKQTTELALHFGADDVDGTIDDSTKIYSMAGAEDQRPCMTIEEIHRMAERSALRAVERDTHYHEIEPV